MDYASLIGKLDGTFDSGRTRPEAWRRGQIGAIEALLNEREDEIMAALAEDLAKPRQESFAELSVVRSGIRHCQKKLGRWMKPRRVATPMVGKPGKSWIHPEPLGTVLIIGPWNYPVQLLLAPLVTAVAAGNTVVLKPSELAPASARLMAELVPRYLDDDAVAVVPGGVPETTALLECRFQHIVYTGSGRVGRIVMRAASEHLTPITLELGGKSPAVVDQDADLESAARRIVWGKCLNAGQTCIAPDYVLVHRDRRDELVDQIRQVLADMYGDDIGQSPDYARIVNDEHFHRLLGHLGCGRVAVGGRSDAATRFIEPTVLLDVDENASVMTEEVFGPVLPVLTVGGLNEALDFIRQRDKPLAAYLFTRSAAAEERFISEISAGSICVNDTLMFMTVPDLPFGGVGSSGMGQYKGRGGFERLSHLKAVMRRGRKPEINVRFPPYSALKLKLLRMLG